MYNESASIMKIAGSATITAGGAALLPVTSGNNVGLILAYGAITIGLMAIIGQIIVRVVRHHYQNQSK